MYVGMSHRKTSKQTIHANGNCGRSLHSTSPADCMLAMVNRQTKGGKETNKTITTCTNIDSNNN